MNYDIALVNLAGVEIFRSGSFEPSIPVKRAVCELLETWPISVGDSICIRERKP